MMKWLPNDKTFGSHEIRYATCASEESEFQFNHRQYKLHKYNLPKNNQ